VLAVTALQKNPETEPANPQWDSLDKLEIISAIHDTFGQDVADLDDLDNFSDFESLLTILKKHNLVH
jgi:acyl carrier protein